MKLFIDGDNMDPRFLFQLRNQDERFRDVDISLFVMERSARHWEYFFSRFGIKYQPFISKYRNIEGADFFLIGELYKIYESNDHKETIALMTSDRFVFHQMNCLTSEGFNTILIVKSERPCKVNVNEIIRLKNTVDQKYMITLPDEEMDEIIQYCFGTWAKSYPDRPFDCITLAKLIRLVQLYGLRTERIKDRCLAIFDTFEHNSKLHVRKYAGVV